jgi:hypothetical protein
MILRHYRTPLAVIAATTAFAAIFVTLALSGFHRPTPHRIRVAIVAPTPVAQRVRAGLDHRVPGGFDLRSLPSERRARVELAHREVDAAVAVSPHGLRLLTAEAGGTAPTQAITNAFTALAAETGRSLTVTDVVAPLSGDSQALSPFFLVLCVLFPSLATGIAAGHVLRRTPAATRIGVLVAVAGVTGLAVAGIAEGISGLGHYWAIAGIVALFSLAISAPTAALGQIRPHLGALCVFVFLMVGVPASGGPANLAAFGPDVFRALGSGLPLGVAANAVRNTVYVHAADTTGHLWVLSAYAAGGLAVLCLLIAVGQRRRGGEAELDADVPGVAAATSALLPA